MTIEVVIPTCRTELLDPLLASFVWDPPDIVTLVTNLDLSSLRKRAFPFEVRALRFTTTTYAQGKYDVSLRRNVGAYASRADSLCFFDDDQIAAIGMLSAGRRLLDIGEVAVWGSYRFINFGSVNLMELPMVQAHHGTPRERPGQLALWKSAFGGLLFIQRETLLEVNGFDMLFTRGSGEDQNLALRLGQTWLMVHEPPFAWHPDTKLASLPDPHRSACHECSLSPRLYNSTNVLACDACPYMERADLEVMPEYGPVVPFDIKNVEYRYEALPSA